MKTTCLLTLAACSVAYTSNAQAATDASLVSDTESVTETRNADIGVTTTLSTEIVNGRPPYRPTPRSPFRPPPRPRF